MAGVISLERLDTITSGDFPPSERPTRRETREMACELAWLRRAREGGIAAWVRLWLWYLPPRPPAPNEDDQ